MAFLNDHSFRELSSKKSIALFNCLLQASKLSNSHGFKYDNENDNSTRLNIAKYFIIFLDVGSN